MYMAKMLLINEILCNLLIWNNVVVRHNKIWNSTCNAITSYGNTKTHERQIKPVVLIRQWTIIIEIMLIEGGKFSNLIDKIMHGFG